jgi:hypothetical protein
MIPRKNVAAVSETGNVKDNLDFDKVHALDRVVAMLGRRGAGLTAGGATL